MRIILHSSSFYIFGAIILIGGALYLLFNAFTSEEQELITAIVELGDVTEIVSVSGVVEAENTAHLAFPVSGIVTEVYVNEGDSVKKGALLTILASSQLAANRLATVAALHKAEANRDELIAGPRDEERTVTNTSLENARDSLKQTILSENKKVENARRTLLSSSLEAYSSEGDENAVAPTITGTYTCEGEGSYVLEMYASSAQSGYSFVLSGLESNSNSAFVDSPGPFGECGLFAQFDNNSKYSNSNWVVEIPNTRSGAYQTNLNTYNLAIQTKENSIEVAENNLVIAQEKALLSNAPPRIEELVRADAEILQAQSRISVIDAQIGDRSIIAPFDGVITEVSILRGETADTTPIITLLASDDFDLTARIPEIDITKVEVGQSAELIFDARQDEIIKASIILISPLATEIDGVAYFEATIQFEDIPHWLRSGLNADVNILVAVAHNVLHVPRRFITTEDNTNTILVKDNETITATPVEIGFSGNDGEIQIIGLNEGVTVVAP